MTYNEYTGVFNFERQFDPMNTAKWLEANWAHSMTLSIFYITFIYFAKKMMYQRKPFSLKKPLFTWNLFLAVFSAIGVLKISPEFFDALFTEGFQYSICNISYIYGVSGFWTRMFVMSKALELIDTVFIVLRKRPLTFLHIYHHTTVLIYTWHACKDHTATGRWFIWMNYTVHSFMYTYYACRSSGMKLNKWLQMLLTTLQLVQMVIGCYIALSAYFIKLRGEQCSQTYENLYFCFFIYFTYFLLFAKFFYDAYIKKYEYNNIILTNKKQL